MASPELTIETQVQVLLKEAEGLLNDSRLDEAIQKYTEVLLHDKENRIALEKLEYCWQVKRGERTIDSIQVEQGAVEQVPGEGGQETGSGLLDYGQDLPAMEQSGPVFVTTEYNEPVEESLSQSGEISSIERFTQLAKETLLELNISLDELASLKLDPLSEWALTQIDGKRTIEDIAKSCLLEPEQVITMFEDLVFRGVVSPCVNK